MDDAARQALAIDRSSPARDRTVDITTIGRRSGRPRRIEIWFYRADGKIYLSSLPAKRSWYANLKVNPSFTFHLKNGVHADLPAAAKPITHEAERRRIFTQFVYDLNQPSNPGRIPQPTSVDDWVAGSPLMEISFDEEAEDGRRDHRSTASSGYTAKNPGEDNPQPRPSGANPNPV